MYARDEAVGPECNASSIPLMIRPPPFTPKTETLADDDGVTEAALAHVFPEPLRSLLPESVSDSAFHPAKGIGGWKHGKRHLYLEEGPPSIGIVGSNITSCSSACMPSSQPWSIPCPF